MQISEETLQLLHDLGCTDAAEALYTMDVGGGVSTIDGLFIDGIFADDSDEDEDEDESVW